MRAMVLMSRLPWPTHGGQEVHAHYLMRALADRGHEIRLVLLEPPQRDALDAWPLHDRISWVCASADSAPRDEASQSDPNGPAATYVHGRWARYWGQSPHTSRAVEMEVERWRPDYVEAFGLDILPILANVPPPTPRIWMAGDDWCIHHLTQLGGAPNWRDRLTALRHAARMAAYERSFSKSIDLAVAVSPLDQWGLRRLGGFRNVLLAPSGVDFDHYRPTAEAPRRLTAVFWGRLDYQPNIDAVSWFAEHVWPRLVHAHPRAIWRIVGRSPVAQVSGIADDHPRIELHTDVPDVRPHVWDSAVAVIPMRSGAGIKNKLLEAAAMGRPIVASPDAERGLEYTDRPWQLARTPDEWIHAIRRLWTDLSIAQRHSDLARRWVTTNHNWQYNALQRERFVQDRISALEQHDPIGADVMTLPDESVRSNAA